MPDPTLAECTQRLETAFDRMLLPSGTTTAASTVATRLDIPRRHVWTVVSRLADTGRYPTYRIVMDGGRVHRDAPHVTLNRLAAEGVKVIEYANGNRKIVGFRDHWKTGPVLDSLHDLRPAARRDGVKGCSTAYARLAEHRKLYRQRMVARYAERSPG